MSGSVFDSEHDPGGAIQDLGSLMVADRSEDPPLDRDDRGEHPADRRSPFSEHDLHAQRKWRCSLESVLHKKGLQRVAQHGVLSAEKWLRLSNPDLFDNFGVFMAKSLLRLVSPRPSRFLLDALLSSSLDAASCPTSSAQGFSRSSMLLLMPSSCFLQPFMRLLIHVSCTRYIGLIMIALARLHMPVFVSFCIGNNCIESHASFLLATRLPVTRGGCQHEIHRSPSGRSRVIGGRSRGTAG